jgi:ankyrin repeat protein
MSEVLTNLIKNDPHTQTAINDNSAKIPLNIEAFKQVLRDYIKSKFLDFVENKEVLLASYMQNSPLASQMGTSSKLVLFRDTDDKYGFFSNIQNNSTSTMNNTLKDINMTSAIINANKSKDERLEKYFYLLHSVNSVGLTTLQWACFYNRVDIVMLILSYLVGGDKEYVRKYINYFNNNADNDTLYTGRAYDMIGRSTNISLYKSMVQSLESNSTQAVKSIGSLVGNLLSFNLKTGLVDIFRKTKNVITAPGQVPLDVILIAFGSIQYGKNTETNNGLDIKDKYHETLMLSDTTQNLSMGVSNVPKNAMNRLRRGYNSFFGSKTEAHQKGGKYKSRRYHKQNNRFTRCNYINKSSRTRR